MRRHEAQRRRVRLPVTAAWAVLTARDSLRLLPLDVARGDPEVLDGLKDRLASHSFRYSRSRRVCVRLTGISVSFSSFIRKM